MRITAIALGALLSVAACTATPSTTSRSSPTAADTATPLTTPRLTPPSATPTEAVPGFKILESDVWARLRLSLPADIPLPRTTWLPTGVDPVVNMNATMTPVGYELTYWRGGDVVMHYRVGTAVPVGTRLGSGIGTRVRGLPATLDFDTSLFQNPGGRGQRRVSWRESAYGLAIESEVLSGDDLLHVAWSLDPTGGPSDPAKAVRSRDGACASNISGEATVRAYVTAIGSHDPGRLADCWALGSDDADQRARIWSELPATSALDLRDGGPIGGREWFLTSWTFNTDPGGAFNQRQTMFFMVGLESGRYRMFEAGTGAYGPPP